MYSDISTELVDIKRPRDEEKSLAREVERNQLKKLGRKLDGLLLK